MILTFKQYIFGSKSLLDESFKDIIKQYPHDKDTLTSYRDTLTSAGHDYSDHKLRWLYRQHLNGNLTPDHPDLHKTLETLRTHVSVHGVKDPWNKTNTFKDLHGLMKPHFDTASTKKANAESGRVLLNNINNTKIYHIQTKNASQHFYNQYGIYPTGKNGSGGWCTSSRSNDCLFGKAYGPMYTFHHGNNYWSVHPEQKIVTSEKNDGDIKYDDFLKKHPEYEETINYIHNHWKNTPEGRLHSGKIENSDFKYLYDNFHNLTTTSKELLSHNENFLNNIFDNKDKDYSKVKEILKYSPNIKSNHVKELLKLNNEDINKSIAYNNKIDLSSDQIEKLMNTNDTEMLSALASHKSLNNEHIDHLISKKNQSINLNLSSNPSIKSHHIHDLIKTNDNIQVLKNLSRRNDLNDSHITALISTGNKNINKDLAERKHLSNSHISNLIKTKDENVLHTLAKRKDLTGDHVFNILKHTNSHVEGLDTSKLENHHIDNLLSSYDKNDREHPLNRHSVNFSTKHIDEIIKNPNLLHLAINSEHLNPNHINSLLDNYGIHAAIKLSSHKNASDENIKKMINMSDEDYHQGVVSQIHGNLLNNKNLTGKNLDNLVNWYKNNKNIHRSLKPENVINHNEASKEVIKRLTDEGLI